MKIVCDCGREVEFIPDPSVRMEDGSVHCKKSDYDIMLEAQHDEIWMVCDCGNNFHIYT